MATPPCGTYTWSRTASWPYLVVPLQVLVSANIWLIPNRKRLRAFDPELYKKRNPLERFLSKIRRFRAVASRSDKRDDKFFALVQLALLRIWFRTNESVT